MGLMCFFFLYLNLGIFLMQPQCLTQQRYDSNFIYPPSVSPRNHSRAPQVHIKVKSSAISIDNSMLNRTVGHGPRSHGVSVRF